MTLRLLLLLAAALAAASVPTAAQTPGASGNPLQSAADLAVRRGQLLYAYDQAAWHGTDDFRAKFPSDVQRAGGWVVTGTVAETSLVFFDRDPARPKAIYRARLAGSRLVSSDRAKPGEDSLGTEELAIIAARSRALETFQAAKVGLCSKAPANVAILPPERTGGPHIVYLMTPRTEADKLPFGGHFSVEVFADGRTGPVRKFTNTCLNLPTRPPGGDGSTPAGLFVTHLLDPTPTEIHVFNSLAMKLPVLVGTSNRIVWAVEGSGIRKMSDR
jgi:hypothetical protein